MSQAAVAPPVEPAEPPARGFGAVLADMYFAPSAAFADVARAPRFLLPLAIMVALNLAFTITWVSKVDLRQFMKAQMEASGQELTAEQMESAISIQEKIFKPMAFAGGLLGAPIMIMVAGGVLMLVFRSVFGAEITFAQSASVVAWSFMAVGLVTTPLMFLVFALKGDWNLDPSSVLQASPVLLLDRSSVPAALYTLAGCLDLFSFWVLALLAIGYGVVTRRSAGSALWGVAPFWIAYVAIKVLFAALRG